MITENAFNFYTAVDADFFFFFMVPTTVEIFLCGTVSLRSLQKISPTDFELFAFQKSEIAL